MEKRHLARMILEQGSKFPDQPAMKWKENGEWKSISYSELSRRILNIAFSLKKMGIDNGDRVAIFSDNRPEWSIGDFAILTIGATTVPIYATSTPDQAGYIVKDSASKAIMIGSRQQYNDISHFRKEQDLIVISFEEKPSPGTIPFKDLWKYGHQ